MICLDVRMDQSLTLSLAVCSVLSVRGGIPLFQILHGPVQTVRKREIQTSVRLPLKS